jgi:hypothetical protein
MINDSKGRSIITQTAGISFCTKNIMEKTEDEVKLTCHTAKQKVEEISHVLAICQSAVLTKFSPA